jgi:hypothetical protein
MQKLGWLNNVSSMYLEVFFLLLIGQKCWNISSGTSPCFPLAGGFC